MTSSEHERFGTKRGLVHGPVTEMTVEEMSESLTGFDEIAIAQRFGMEWTELGETKPSMFIRSLIMVHLLRGDSAIKQVDAYEQAMRMSVDQTSAYFTEGPDDADDDADEEFLGEVSSSGKDGAPPATEPTSSPPSASRPVSPLTSSTA